MATMHGVIEALRNAPSNSERGTTFEQFMVRYFDLDAPLSTQYDEVWRWTDWPAHKGMTTGIDMVTRDKTTGDLTAIHGKFYAPTDTLANGDIDSLFTASGRKPFVKGIIILDHEQVGQQRRGRYSEPVNSVKRIGLEEISASPVDWDIAWLNDDLHVSLNDRQQLSAPAAEDSLGGETGVAGPRIISVSGQGRPSLTGHIQAIQTTSTGEMWRTGQRRFPSSGR